MLLIRRVAPDGGIYGSARGIGIYSAIQGSLGVLIAFMIFLAFQNYLGARTASQDEATAVLELFRNAELFPAPYHEQEHAQLTCYARAVIGPEWRAMGNEHSSPAVDDVIRRMEVIFAAGVRSGRVTGPAASIWLADSNLRADGRQRRLAEAQPFVPPLLWVMLGGGTLVILLFLLGFADRKERALGLAMIAAAPAAILASGLVLVYFFDHPYANTTGSIGPAAMQRTLDRMVQIQGVEGMRLRLPCDANGRPTTNA
jgi:hypothetical protein